MFTQHWIEMILMLGRDAVVADKEQWGRSVVDWLWR